MHSIEPTFSEKSDRVEKDNDTALARAHEERLSSVEKQGSVNEGIEPGDEKHSQPPARKTLSSGSLEREKSVTGELAGAASSAASMREGEDTPRRLPAVSAGKAPEMAFRPPQTARKNVIPSRRATFDPARASAAMQNSAVATSQARGSSSTVPQAVSTAPDSPADVTHTNNSATPQVAPAVPATPVTPIPPVALEMSAPPVAVAAPTAPVEEAESVENREGEQEHPVEQTAAAHTDYWADLSTQAGLPITYHDTSAAEEAWREVDLEQEVAQQDTRILPVTAQNGSGSPQTAAEEAQRAAADLDTRKIAAPVTPLPPLPLVTPLPPTPPPVLPAMGVSSEPDAPFIDAPTTPLPMLAPVKPLEEQRKPLSRKKALLMVALLAILLVNAIAASFNQSFGAQGWATVWGNDPGSNQNLLTQIAQQMQHSPTPSTGGGTATAIPTQSPTQIVNLILSNMSLDEKIGQMMMVQFTGPDYSPQLDAMVSQYKVGSVLVFAANGNIVSKSQLKHLTAQMQKNAFLPLAISIDQEGGTVDRLINLDGAQPAAATIGATGNTQKAYQQGVKDAQNLVSYGLNVNLAPVVDVTNVYNPQLYNRTYGNNPTIVTSMAGAYLKGLQKSGKVIGTLKHFPGLGDVSVDPHFRPPDLQRSLSGLNSIDWAPYANLINQGNVYAIMVTHEYVKALDSSEPSSLSPKVIGILRNQMHFQGVIMTDSLTMDSISNYYSPGQAAAMAVEAGDDMLMGASSPDDLAIMIKGIKQAVSSGQISQQHIDDSVRRILLLKYQMGLIHV